MSLPSNPTDRGFPYKGAPPSAEAGHGASPGTAQGHVLVVDDEMITRTAVAKTFRVEGFVVSEAGSGSEMRQVLEESEAEVDVILLDINLPDASGFDLAREVRARTDTIGLIMLTSRKEDIDRIVGLEIGADDYVTKPFHLRELTVRVRNLLRRLRARPDTPSANAGMQRRFRGWSLDLAKRRLTNPEGEMVTLTPGEFGLLTTLVERPGNALTRDQLMDGIGGSDSASTDRSVDVLIGRLRRKLGDDPKAPDFILTVPGVGYMFAETIE